MGKCTQQTTTTTTNHSDALVSEKEKQGGVIETAVCSYLMRNIKLENDMKNQ